MLCHDAVKAPGSQGVVESLVGSTKRLLLRSCQASFVKLVQITHAEIVGGCSHPGIAAGRHRVGEALRMLKNESRVRAGLGLYSVPVDVEMQIDIEVCDHRTPADLHVCRRGDIGLFYILHLLNQRLLRSASIART